MYWKFTTDLKLKSESLNIVDEAKLLGLILTSDLKWNRNTQKIVKDANSRMRMLHITSKFIKNKQDLIHINKTFIRSKLEYCCTVWHSSLSKTNVNDIERIQKSAVKLILKENYENYECALKLLNLDRYFIQKERKIVLKVCKKMFED